MVTLADQLDELTHPGELVEQLDEGALRCTACAHRCLIKPGRRGICKVRFNHEGELRVPWGYVAALQIDPNRKSLNHSCRQRRADLRMLGSTSTRFLPNC